MQHRWILLSALLVLLSCQGQKAQRSLTLMTYNVGVFSKYEDNTTSDVAQLILDRSATLVALNELDSCNTRHSAYQLKELAQALGPDWAYHFARAIPYREGAYGNGVVSEKAVSSSYIIPLPQGDGSEARSVAVVETADCVFAATHLDHRSANAAMVQVRKINEWFTTRYAGCGKPVFLCGDFNVLPDSEVIALALERWTLLSGTDLTYSTKKRSKCIDYIFAFKDAAPVEVQNAEVLVEGTENLSDHYPVLITVKY
jgi:endonuclease/exonuclease/phosphatase family metal-dependent hydrolase